MSQFFEEMDRNNNIINNNKTTTETNSQRIFFPDCCVRKNEKEGRVMEVKFANEFDNDLMSTIKETLTPSSIVFVFKLFFKTLHF